MASEEKVENKSQFPSKLGYIVGHISL